MIGNHWLERYIPGVETIVLRKIVLVVLGLALLELAILIQLATLIGIWETFALLFGIGALGLVLARSQGMRTLTAIQNDLAHGRMPAPRLIDQAMIMAGGILFLLPGLLSDLAGILLVIPFTRAVARKIIAARIAVRLGGRRQERNDHRRGRSYRGGTDLSDQASYKVVE